MRRLATGLCLLTAAWPAAAEPVRIGVLVNWQTAHPETKWQPLAAALTRSVAEREFAVVPLDEPALEAAVAARQVDFVLTHPAHYVLLARRSGLSAPLATLMSQYRGVALHAYGGVIVARADRAGLDGLGDLRGRTVASVGAQSLAGYLAQAGDLAAIGLRQPRDFRLLVTGYPQEKVVEAVLEGSADAGFLLAGVMEEMAADGRLDPARLKVLNRQDLPAFPHAVSTRLYPGWPFAALAHAPEDLSRKVAAALLRLKDDGAAAKALGIHGFTVPANYGAVEALMRKLRAPPFDAVPEFGWGDVWQRYRAWIAALAAAGALVLLLSFRLHRGKRRSEAQARALADERRRLDDIIEATRAGTWEWNVQSGETVFNARWAEIVGYTLEELAPLSIETWARLAHPDDLQRSNALLARHFAGELDHYVCESRMRHKGGHWVWVMDRGRLVSRTPDGKPLLMSGTHQDITPRKQADEEIVELNRSLEKRVRLRTAELETALHELEDFSYAASHDLRAPLRAVDGFAQILGEEYAPRLDEIAQGYLERIRHASRHLSEVIDNLVGLIGVSRKPLALEEVDLGALARGILSELQAREPRAVAVVVVGDGLTARADAELIEVALRRLLHNAWKFTGQAPHARIEFGAAEANGERIFFVADNGAGFNPAYASNLFRPFFRLHRPDEFPGAGIGLAIVQRIVRRHSGRVWATAAPGRGATFHFTLSTPDLHRPEMT
ncbi:MAG: hypothetical protein BroJett006_20290 [Betaproteobacteria bacterium]|nr:MAG: hypothetical protein BroJett006_20290 [Betaproteobacteria bacterium]